MPYDGYLGSVVDAADHLKTLLMDESSGIDRPAAILVEAVPGEGGINVAGKKSVAINSGNSKMRQCHLHAR